MAPRKALHLYFALAVLLAGFGHLTYACADMEMQPQPICCCEEALERDCGPTGEHTSVDASCCTTALEALGERGPTVNAITKPADVFADQPPDDTCLAYTLGRRFAPRLERGPRLGCHLALAPSHGTRTYLRTLRLRI